jgi:hypothetical protein
VSSGKDFVNGASLLGCSDWLETSYQFRVVFGLEVREFSSFGGKQSSCCPWAVSFLMPMTNERLAGTIRILRYGLSSHGSVEGTATFEKG